MLNDATYHMSIPQIDLEKDPFVRHLFPTPSTRLVSTHAVHHAEQRMWFCASPAA